MSSPRRRTRPAETGRSPEMRLNREVLPAPLGPITPRNSPSFSSIDTLSTMDTSPIFQVSSSVVSTGIVGLTLHRYSGRRDLVGVQRLDQLRLAADQFHLEH